MVKKVLFCVLTIGLSFFLNCSEEEKTTCPPCEFPIEVPEPGKLNAYPVLDYMIQGSYPPPDIDGRATDRIWEEAREYSVETNDGKDGFTPTIRLKAVYDSYSIYILARWDDVEASVQDSMWWNGNTPSGSVTISNGSYPWTQIGSHFEGTVVDTSTSDTLRIVTISGNEDKMAIMWNVSSPDFLTCTNFCHGDRMRTDTDEYVDLWHWKAGRTHPVGYVDDLYLTDVGTGEDSGTGCYTQNIRRGNPQYQAPDDPGANVDFLFESDKINYRTEGWTAGNTIPGWILDTPSGSRADVEAASEFNEGLWTVEMKRTLSATEVDSNDVLFDPNAQADVDFHLAVWDNASGRDHAISVGVHTLHFQQLVKE